MERSTCLALFASVACVAANASAAAAPKDRRPVIALLSVTGGAGFADKEVSSVEEVLLSALEQTGRFNVIGRTDLQALLKAQSQRQAIGCEADTDCMAAIAGALGADYVAAAMVGRLGTATVLTFKVIDARRATALVHARKTVTADAELIPAADAIAREVVAGVFGPGLPPGAIAGKPISSGRAAGISSMVVGVAAIAVAAVLGVTVTSDTKALQSEPTGPIQSRVNSINGRAIGANTLFGVGGVLAAGGVGLAVAF